MLPQSFKLLLQLVILFPRLLKAIFVLFKLVIQVKRGREEKNLGKAQDTRIEAAQRDYDRLVLWITNSETRAYVVLTAQSVLVLAYTYLLPALFPDVRQVLTNNAHMPSRDGFHIYVDVGLLLIGLLGIPLTALVVLFKIIQATHDRGPNGIKPFYETVAETPLVDFKKKRKNMLLFGFAVLLFSCK